MKHQIEIPTELGDLTLRQFQKFSLIDEPTNEDLVSCFLDLDIKTIRALNSNDFDFFVDRLNSILNTDSNLVSRFSYNGVTYGFEPNLDNCTYGVNKDASKYLGDIQTYHKAIEVLYRPITENYKGKYTIKEYEGTSSLSESFKDTPLDIALGMNVFFYRLTKDLLSYIPKFLAKELEEALVLELDSLENGQRIKKFIHSLKEI